MTGSRTAIPGFRPAGGVADGDAAREQIRGSTTILEILRMYPDGRAAKLMSSISGRAPTVVGPSANR